MYVKKCDVCGKIIDTVEHLSLASNLEVVEGDTENTSLTSCLPLNRIDICKDCKYKLLHSFLDEDVLKAIINGLKLDTGFLVDSDDKK